MKASCLRATIVVVATGASIKLCLIFLIGLVAGGAVMWGYVRLLRATVRFYEYYIRERIDKQREELSG